MDMPVEKRSQIDVDLLADQLMDFRIELIEATRDKLHVNVESEQVEQIDKRENVEIEIGSEEPILTSIVVDGEFETHGETIAAKVDYRLVAAKFLPNAKPGRQYRLTYGIYDVE